ncbi:MFS transporter [Rhodococcus sp. NBC_00294]|uniref:MFS transporter n=1 Tax=Rhodococcus sp. NBC_00294 TaxID=2976004 RepID=UPI002E2B3C62|nr:MFS transporter [Rhodococcus sp. NBC_00294]
MTRTERTGAVDALRSVRHEPGAPRLVALRVASQFGDGMFQAALGGAILFDPQRGGDPAAIAAGFAVLLLPYSLIGPFAARILDRVDRATVLARAGIVKSLLILCATGQLVAGASTTAVLITALAVVGVSRFVLAGLSASLPHVVPVRSLVATNAALVTVGAVVSAVGASVAVLVLGLVGPSDRATALATAVSAVGAVAATLLARGFASGRLGPGAASVSAPTRRVLADWVSGFVAVRRTPSVAAALVGVGAHRVAFGIDTLVMVLVLREGARSSVLPGGVAGFGLTVGAAAAGMFLAALGTPVLLPRLGRTRTVVGALVLATLTQATLVVGLVPDLLILAAFLLGFAGQTVKLTADAAMQTDIDDDTRGRVFGVQDTVFNVAFVGAVAGAALVIGPGSTAVDTSAAIVCVIAGVVAYAAAAAIALRIGVRTSRPTTPGALSPHPHD